MTKSEPSHQKGQTMANLGLWETFIAESEIFGWYAPSEALLASLADFRPDGTEMTPFSEAAFAQLHKSTVAHVNRSVQPFNPAYHNDRHFRGTEHRGLEAADAFASGSESKMPKLVRQVFGLALYSHDAHHCASTLRMDAPRGVYNPDLGTRVSTEWVTAEAINAFMSKKGVSAPARLFQTGVIYASTYGGNTPRGTALGIPDPRPRDVWGTIMRAADVCPPRDFTTWLREGIAVSYGEVPASPSPTTLESFIANRVGFIGYVEFCFSQMDAAAWMELSRTLGWRERIVTMKRGLEQLGAGSLRLHAILSRELSHYNVALT